MNDTAGPVNLAREELIRLSCVLLDGLLAGDSVDARVAIVVRSESLALHVNVTAKQVVQVVPLLHERHELPGEDALMATFYLLLLSGDRALAARAVTVLNVLVLNRDIFDRL